MPPSAASSRDRSGTMTRHRPRRASAVARPNSGVTLRSPRSLHPESIEHPDASHRHSPGHRRRRGQRDLRFTRRCSPGPRYVHRREAASRAVGRHRSLSPVEARALIRPSLITTPQSHGSRPPGARSPTSTTISAPPTTTGPPAVQVGRCATSSRTSPPPSEAWSANLSPSST